MNQPTSYTSHPRLNYRLRESFQDLFVLDRVGLEQRVPQDFEFKSTRSTIELTHHWPFSKYPKLNNSLIVKKYPQNYIQWITKIRTGSVFLQLISVRLPDVWKSDICLNSECKIAKSEQGCCYKSIQTGCVRLKFS